MEIEELIRVWTLGRILAFFKPNNQEHIILNVHFSGPCTALEYLTDFDILLKINLPIQDTYADWNVAYMQ